jgi:hypothetical protein
MRAQILALAVTVVSGVTACSIDVRERDRRRQAPLGTFVASEDSGNAAGDKVIYPRARRVANLQTDPTNVSFTGSFADTRVIECRGNINIRRSRRTEQPVCIERPSSQVVQLATGARWSYRLVAVKPRGTAAEFTLVSVYVR